MTTGIARIREVDADKALKPLKNILFKNVLVQAHPEVKNLF